MAANRDEIRCPEAKHYSMPWCVEAPCSPACGLFSPLQYDSVCKANRNLQATAVMQHENFGSPGCATEVEGLDEPADLFELPDPTAEQQREQMAVAASKDRYRNHNLQEALQKHGNAKPRTAEWLL
eukprot:scaffold286861_cov22-Prasinocladus_malaysianus.AAC.1